MKKLLCIVALVVAGCGGLSESDSNTVFAYSNIELHTLHEESVLSLDPVPETYSYDCPESGTIEMVVVFEGETFKDLLHEFIDCDIGDLTFNGNLDYFDIEEGICGGSGFGFDIVGDLAVTGSVDGDCSIDAREECGEFTGTACGHSL